MVLLRTTASGAGCSVCHFQHGYGFDNKPDIMYTDVNLPVCAVAALLVLVFLTLRRPSGSFMEKISRLDWMFVVIPCRVILLLITVSMQRERPHCREFHSRHSRTYVGWRSLLMEVSRRSHPSDHWSCRLWRISLL